MIFSPITKLSSKAEKAFCFELIDVYCRHIEVYCQAHEINIPKRSLSNEIISEEPKYKKERKLLKESK